MKNSKKPNILFLITDQHRHNMLGSVDPRIKTPTLDALSERGVHFSQAVCNVPMCVPSRYSLMSGLYGFQTGVKHNTQMIAKDTDLPAPMLPQLLKDQGYQTAGFGKTHWYIGGNIIPDVPIEGSRRGFEVRAIRDNSQPLNYEPDSLYMGDDAPEAAVKLAEEIKRFGPGGESVKGYTGMTSDVGSDEHAEAWLTKQALKFLDNQRDPDRPFFLYLSFDFPHPGFNVPAGFEEMYDTEDFPDNPPPDVLPGGHRSGDRLEDVWPKMSKEERRGAWLRYASVSSYVDSLFGKVIDKLKETGELDNTFIVFTSDHGDMMGDRGRVSKYSLYEGSIRVPLIIAGPGVEAQDSFNEEAAELVDIVPTLLDVAGVTISDYFPGQSLLTDFSRSASFAEMHGRGYEEYQRAPAIMLRSKEWKLILHIPGTLGAAVPDADNIEGELYNLSKDPREMEDLFDVPEHLAIREKMSRQLIMKVMCALGRFPGGPSRTKINITGPETKPDASIW